MSNAKLCGHLVATSKKPKIFVAMSGGVDSSVAAFLLKKEGYDVEGVTMKNLESDEAVLRAKEVCKKLGIPHHILDISKKFKKEIIDKFISEYEAGRTPNPCVRCNRLVKFGELLKFTKKNGGAFLATGHYARIKREIPNPKSQIRNKSKIQNPKFKTVCRLLRGTDQKKDQTYFLNELTQKQLQKIIFPLGEMIKDDVKKIAQKNKLPIMPSESHEVCFVDTDLKKFLSSRVKYKPGEAYLTTGEKIGAHTGLPFYTIGQRAGIGGKGPFYVVKLDTKKNRLIVSNDGDALLSRKLTIKQINWLSGVEPKLPLNANVQIRYHDTPETAIIYKEGKNYTIEFSRPKRAVTSGQSAVIYKGEECLGGGIIA